MRIQESGSRRREKLLPVARCPLPGNNFGDFPVRDLSITRTPLEKIIESINLESNSFLPEKV